MRELIQNAQSVSQVADHMKYTFFAGCLKLHLIRFFLAKTACYNEFS